MDMDMDTEHVVEAEERTTSELYPTETSLVLPITALDSTSAASASVNALNSLAATPVKVKAVKYPDSDEESDYEGADEADE